MGSSEKLIRTFRDGTVKHRNFFTGLEAWAIPGRSERPVFAREPGPSPEDTRGKGHDDLCNFCPARYRMTPPEKSRLIEVQGRYKRVEQVPAEQLSAEPAAFRRISNLYEILTFDYWTGRYGYTPPPEILAWHGAYLDSDEGYAHVKGVLEMKHGTGPVAPVGNVSGAGDPVGNGTAVPAGSGPDLTPDEVRTLALPFFAGSHELIVARRHLKDGAEGEELLCASGDLTGDEHYAFIRFSLDALSTIRELNPHVAYVAFFQNWLKPAGASFDHLHKQLVGMDDHGLLVGMKLARCAEDPDAFRTFLRLAIDEDLVIAANDHGVILADSGQPFPTALILSFSGARTPEAMSAESLRGLSDLVHACHAAWDRRIPANEEWTYTPHDAKQGFPLHVTIKWRMNNPAGFEGATGYCINPMAPHAFRDKTASVLEALRSRGAVACLRIRGEGMLSSDILHY